MFNGFCLTSHLRTSDTVSGDLKIEIYIYILSAFRKLRASPSGHSFMV